MDGVVKGGERPGEGIEVYTQTQEHQYSMVSVVLTAEEFELVSRDATASHRGIAEYIREAAIEFAKGDCFTNGYGYMRRMARLGRSP